MFLGTLSVGSDGMIYGITKFDALFCVGILMLIAIWTQIATMHHMMLERKGEMV